MASTTRSNDTSLFEIVEEVVNLSVGFVIVLLPALILAAPGLILIVVPVVVLLAVAAVPLALLVPPFLLMRAILGRR